MAVRNSRLFSSWTKTEGENCPHQIHSPYPELPVKEVNEKIEELQSTPKDSIQINHLGINQPKKVISRRERNALLAKNTMPQRQENTVK